MSLGYTCSLLLLPIPECSTCSRAHIAKKRPRADSKKGYEQIKLTQQNDARPLKQAAKRRLVKAPVLPNPRAVTNSRIEPFGRSMQRVWEQAGGKNMNESDEEFLRTLHDESDEELMPQLHDQTHSDFARARSPCESG